MCQNQNLKLTCPANHVINLSEANYGRTVKGDVCPAGVTNVDNCFSSNSLSISKSHCQGKSECTLFVNDEKFGDPCSGVTKYLEVFYECSEKGKYF